MRRSNWPDTIRTIIISIFVGAVSGVLATALTTMYLYNYATELNEQTSPLQLSQVRPFVFPSTYTESLDKVSTNVFPASVEIFVQNQQTSSYQGAILTSDGWLISVIPVSYQARALQAKIGSKLYPVERIVADTISPIVFLKINANNLPVIAFGNGIDVQPGQQVFMIATSESLFFSTVSGQNFAYQNTNSSDIITRQIIIQNDFSSIKEGAVVVNMASEMVGIVIGKKDQQTIVVPVDTVLPAFTSLLKSDVISRPSIGVKGTSLSQALNISEEVSRGRSHGVVLIGSNSVIYNSPAYKAGIREGDILLSINGEAINAHRTLPELLNKYLPNDTIVITIDHAGEQIDIQVTLGEYKK
ncbi:MAG: S1C family serine protease [Patescibacteria group bacterium]